MVEGLTKNLNKKVESVKDKLSVIFSQNWESTHVFRHPNEHLDEKNSSEAQNIDDSEETSLDGGEGIVGGGGGVEAIDPGMVVEGGIVTHLFAVNLTNQLADIMVPKLDKIILPELINVLTPTMV